MNRCIGEPLAKIQNIIVTSFPPLHEDVFHVVITRKNISGLLILKCAKSISPNRAGHVPVVAYGGAPRWRGHVSGYGKVVEVQVGCAG